MGKIGDLFREARLGKGLTLEQVADETNISKHFLQGIESDDFSDFPGEVYSLGFIRNYAEFLGLDASAMVEIYRSNESTRQAEVEKSESTELPLPVGELSFYTEEHGNYIQSARNIYFMSKKSVS